MAVKKTELYSSLWASCDALRGGMDASQYKDYILTLLFMKYVTDKYKGQKYGDLIVFDKANDPNPDPEKRTGCSFDDFIALKNKKNIGEGIDKIIARLAEVNEGLKGVIDIAHFNDETKIGKNKEMVDKLTKLISIFQRPELDFSKNKAEGDDIIGDAYEYLMRNFASESGKSKGQFYTPAEVSRILAKIIGIDKCSDHDATVCDPACGSGSLLIRALEEAPFEISGYGQEKDSSTAGLAKMNAVLHNKATIKIMAGNTFSDPQFKKAEDASELERFDYIVANPPFSLKNWADGLKEFGRFSGYGDRPPEKNGDYAWLMHILKTLKSTGKAAVILPHGVLFRGNAEATIRQKIIDKGWIKGIISLPPNLFYGTGIPACIIVIDKEGAKNRSGIFMIDASKGYIKEGSKNRLREQDIYRIVTTFNEKITTDPKYARFVLNKEIKGKNEYNLNISRYIDSSDSEDIQDIYAHIHGGIPIADIDALEHFWKVFPSLKDELFDVFSEGYYKLNVEEDVIRQTIYSNEEFIAYGEKIDEAFSICQLTIEGMLITTDAGNYRLASFVDEQRMCRLYEKFILEYYSRHYPELSVSASQIPWALDDGVGTMLPVMQTDIHLQRGNTVLIIDAKYYNHTTQVHFDKHKLHSNNLYQIFTYVKNRSYQFGEEDNTVSGMLLYAKTEEEIQPDNVYQMHGSQISVKTLDLNLPFVEIAEQMDRIVESHFTGVIKAD